MNFEEKTKIEKIKDENNKLKKKILKLENIVHELNCKIKELKNNNYDSVDEYFT